MGKKYETICIYCMGEYGIQTYLELKKMGVQVDIFGDSDLSKQGYIVDGIFCDSYEKIIELDKEKTLIIVCIKNPISIVKDFENKGFKHVIDKNEALNMFNKEVDIDYPAVTDVQVLIEMKDAIADTFYRGFFPKIEEGTLKQILFDYNKRNNN